jgi:hypothetical protein
VKEASLGRDEKLNREGSQRMHKMNIERPLSDGTGRGRTEAQEAASYVVGSHGELALIDAERNAFRVYAPGQWLSIEVHKDLGVAS